MSSLPALVRLAHPLPTILNAGVAAGLTLAAGGRGDQASLAALTMLGVHTSIGALNDLLDRTTDRGRVEKPLTTGEVSERTARTVIATGAAIGLGAASLLGALSLQIAALGAMLGYLYDAGIKRTWASFLPFAFGVALIPLFAWSAASREPSLHILLLSAAAIPGGSALALQNALADFSLDAAVGMRSVVVRIGERTARAAAGVLHFTAWLTITLSGAAYAPAQLVGGVLLIVGLALGWRPSVYARRRGWEISSIGLACCAFGLALSQ
ncbi:MAG: UbiA family prenyltransferase [bacterium]